MPYKIRLRRDVSADWASDNTYLDDGEAGYDKTNNRIKIGPGNWNSLPYLEAFSNQNANLVLAGPATGSAAAPTFRSLVANDIPSLSSIYQPLDATLTALAGVTVAADQVIYSTAADIFTTTGLTSFGRSLIDDTDATAARTTLGLGTLATQSGTFSGTSSGTNTGDQTITLTGDVTGSGTGSFATTIATVPISKGGTGQTTKTAAFDALSPQTTKGDLILFDGTDAVRLAVGATNNHVLTVDSSTSTGVKWAAASGGGTPGGSNTQIQFNDSGTFGGDSALTFNKTTDVLTVTGAVTAIETSQGVGFVVAQGTSGNSSGSGGIQLGNHSTTASNTLLFNSGGTFSIHNGTRSSDPIMVEVNTGTSTFNNDVIANNFQTAGKILLNEDGGVNFVSIEAPSSLSGDSAYILPSSVGTQNQVLSIASVASTTATLQWSTPSSAASAPDFILYSFGIV